MDNIYKEIKLLRKMPEGIKKDKAFTKIVRDMREFTQKLELEVMCKYLQIETDTERIYSEFLDTHRVLFSSDDVLELVVKIEGGYMDMGKFTEEEFETVKEIGIDMETKTVEEFEEKMKEMTEEENEEFEVKVTKMHGEEAEKLMKDIEKKIKKDKLINNLTKIGLFVLGAGVTVAGIFVAKKYAPQDVKLNAGVDLVLDSFKKKREDFTREDISTMTSLFQAKAELKTGIIDGEEYAEQFDKVIK